MNIAEIRDAVACPVCGAAAGRLCHFAGRASTKIHAPRRGAAERAASWVTPGATDWGRLELHRRRWRAEPKRHR